MSAAETAAARNTRQPPGPARVTVGDTERKLSSTTGVWLVLYGLSKRSLPALALGGVLLARGVRGRDPIYEALGISTSGVPARVEVVQSVRVCAPRRAVYDAWRDEPFWAYAMAHLRSVEALGAGRSRWTARGPAALPDVSWDMERTVDVDGARLVWESVPGSEVDVALHVRLSDVPDGTTDADVRIAYRPPAGPVGAVVRAWLGPDLGVLVRHDLSCLSRASQSGSGMSV